MISFRHRYRWNIATAAASRGERAVAAAHRHESETGATPLPDGFPAKALLEAHEPIPITRLEQLEDMTLADLRRVRGIGTKTATAVIEAYDTWKATQ